MNAAPIILALALFAGSAWSTEPIVTVSEYDPSRDAVADLESTIQVAKTHNKRILVVAGFKACPYCHNMSQVFDSDETIRKVLAASFVVMKVNYTFENSNEAFFERYPDFDEFPHFFVLDSDGKLRQSLNPARFEQGQGYGYDRSALGAFLSEAAK